MQICDAHVTAKYKAADVQIDCRKSIHNKCFLHSVKYLVAT